MALQCLLNPHLARMLVLQIQGHPSIRIHCLLSTVLLSLPDNTKAGNEAELLVVGNEGSLCASISWGLELEKK
jgi:hypothetical protein